MEYKELKALKELREKKGYSLGEVAKLLGISKVYYFQIERGRRRLYYFMAMKIAKIFKKKPDQIFYMEFQKSPID